jgi:hypothetical protein
LFANSERFKDAKRQTTQAEVKTSACNLQQKLTTHNDLGKSIASVAFMSEPKLTNLNGSLDPARKLDVVFVHGITGDPTKTWTAENDASLFWPEWILTDEQNIGVWTLGYSAPVSQLTSSSRMGLLDRARNLLSLLRSTKIADRPLIFICHSLGGLLVKQMLRLSCTMRNREWETLRESTKAIFFLSTPHTGADIAAFAKLRPIASLFRTTAMLEDLSANNELLRDLDDWFVQNCRVNGWIIEASYETQPTFGVQVVDAGSANPHVEGCIPIPVDADHITVCKPKAKDYVVYLSAIKLIERVIGSVPPAMTGSRLLTLVPLQSAGRLFFSGDKYEPNAEFELAPDFHLLAYSKRISILEFSAHWYASGCPCLAVARLDQDGRASHPKLSINGTRVGLAGDCKTLEEPFAADPNATYVVKYRGLFRPPLQQDDGFSCIDGDLSVSVSVREEGSGEAKLLSFSFRSVSDGSLTASESLRDVPRLSDGELEAHRRSGSISATEFESLRKVSPDLRLMAVRSETVRDNLAAMGELSPHFYGVLEKLYRQGDPRNHQ